MFLRRSQNHKLSPAEGPWQVDPNHTADIDFFEKSDDCFPSGQLPETFQDPRKTTAPMYASGTPSGNLLGASGTAAKQKRASQPSGQLPVSFRFPSGSFRNSTKTKMLYLCQYVHFC